MRALLVATLLLAGPAVARAQDATFGASDVTGAHALGRANAMRASGLSNDALYLNPAAMTLASRYGFAAHGSYDFQGDQTGFGASIVDSSEGSLAAGLAFNRLVLGPSGARSVENVLHLGLAFQLGDLIAIGVTGKLLHFDGDGAFHGNHLTPDIGVTLHLDAITIGLVGYNLVNVHEAQLPRQWAGALSATLPAQIRAEGDIVLDTVTHPTTTANASIGLEYELFPVLALRGGYSEDHIRDGRFATGGLGFFVPPGFSLDVGYRQGLSGVVPERLLMVEVGFVL